MKSSIQPIMIFDFNEWSENAAKKHASPYHETSTCREIAYKAGATDYKELIEQNPEFHPNESGKLIKKWLDATVKKDESIAAMREVIMRGNLTFPLTEQELKWFDDGFKSDGDLMKRLFKILK